MEDRSKVKLKMMKMKPARNKMIDKRKKKKRREGDFE